MKKIFIYYSHSGNGEMIANYLEDKGFDIRKVIPKKELPHNFFLSILVGGYKAGINCHDKLVDFNSDIKDYDEIYIGSPIWNARLSSPINTVLDKTDLNGKKITFVFYSGSGTSPKATEKVKRLFPKARVIDVKEPKKNKKELNKIK